MGEFCRAVQNGNADQVSYLMGFDVDPAAAWGNQYNALQNACVLGHTGVVKVLLKNGVSPNDYILSSDPRRGSSPLDIALRRDDFELFALLLEYGADPNAPVVNQFGRYSLLFTQIIGRYADRPQLAEQFIVEMLKHDWDINSRDQDNYSAVEWMRAWNVGSLETLRMLKSYGAKDPADTRTLTASPVEFRH